MSDPIAAADQAVEEIKGVARVHGTYMMHLLEEGLDRDEALATLHTFMWVAASHHECEEED